MKRYTITCELLDDVQILDTDSAVKMDNMIRCAIYNGYIVTLIDRVADNAGLYQSYEIRARDNGTTFHAIVNK